MSKTITFNIGDLVQHAITGRGGVLYPGFVIKKETKKSARNYVKVKWSDGIVEWVHPDSIMTIEKAK